MPPPTYDIKRMEGWQRWFFLALVIVLIAVFAAPISGFQCRQQAEGEIALWVEGNMVSRGDFEARYHWLAQAVDLGLGAKMFYLPTRETYRARGHQAREFMEDVTKNHFILLRKARDAGIDVTEAERAEFVRGMLWETVILPSYNSLAAEAGMSLPPTQPFEKKYYDLVAGKGAGLTPVIYSEIAAEVLAVHKWLLITREPPPAVGDVYERWREQNRETRFSWLVAPAEAFLDEEVEKAHADRLVASFQRKMVAQALLVDWARPFSKSDPYGDTERPERRKEYDIERDLSRDYSEMLSPLRGRVDATGPTFQDEEKRLLERYLTPRRFRFEALYCFPADFAAESEPSSEETWAEYDKVKHRYPLRPEDVARWRDDLAAGKLSQPPPKKPEKPADAAAPKEEAEKPAPPPDPANPPEFQPFDWVRERVRGYLKERRAREMVGVRLEKARAGIEEQVTTRWDAVDRDVKKLEARERAWRDRAEALATLFNRDPAGTRPGAVTEGERVGYQRKKGWFNEWDEMYFWREAAAAPFAQFEATTRSLAEESLKTPGLWAGPGKERLKTAAAALKNAIEDAVGKHGGSAMETKSTTAEKAITDKDRYFDAGQLKAESLLTDPEATAATEKEAQDASRFVTAHLWRSLKETFAPFEEKLLAAPREFLDLAENEAGDLPAVRDLVIKRREALADLFATCFAKARVRATVDALEKAVADNEKPLTAKRGEREKLNASSTAVAFDSVAGANGLKVVAVEQLVAERDLPALGLPVALHEKMRPRGAPEAERKTLFEVLGALRDGQMASEWHALAGGGGVVVRRLAMTPSDFATFGEAADRAVADYARRKKARNRAFQFVKEVVARVAARESATPAERLAAWRSETAAALGRVPAARVGETPWVSGESLLLPDGRKALSDALRGEAAGLRLVGDVTAPVESGASDDLPGAAAAAALLEGPRYLPPDAMRWKNYLLTRSSLNSDQESETRTRLSRFEANVREVALFSDVEKKERERRLRERGGSSEEGE
ncbi:MAG: hypothetical protein HY719_09980 [Planctomycetes bacterium]|nr:hypothetical protein [Planctomycetota bacterium]